MNFSMKRSILVNLIDYPPSSWNLSFSTNESLLLDIVLPKQNHMLTPTETTNLTFTEIEAHQLSTNIIGFPANLEIEKILTKQFSLTINQINNQTNQIPSDFIRLHWKLLDSLVQNSDEKLSDVEVFQNPIEIQTFRYCPTCDNFSSEFWPKESNSFRRDVARSFGSDRILLDSFAVGYRSIETNLTNL